MKKAFLLLCTLLLVLGCALPLAAYHLTRAVLGPAVSTVRLPLSSPESTASAPEISAAYAGDADRFLIQDASTGQVLELSRREYLIGAVAAEMPVSWPDEALKAQAVAAHSYALYCRDHAAPDSIGWLTADPARRQGCLTDPVLRSYWGTAYETNYARLSALVDRWNIPYCSATVPLPVLATLPSPTAAPRPAKMSGAPPCPTLFRWTAAPTFPPTITSTP